MEKKLFWLREGLKKINDRIVRSFVTERHLQSLSLSLSWKSYHAENRVALRYVSFRKHFHW